MANLDFYALDQDLRKLFDFLYSETDVVVYELGSRPNSDLRRFASVVDLAEAFDLGTYRATHLQLSSPSIMAPPVIERVEATKAPGPFFWYKVRGVGLMQLYLDGAKTA
jgi:hypothetical protein